MADAVLNFIGSNNGYLPISTKQVIAYVRDPNNFPINNYVQYYPVDKPTFTYPILGKNEFVRLRPAGLNIWADGDDRPVDHENRLRFRMLEHTTVRYNHSARLGYQTIRNNNLMEVQPLHMIMALNNAMMQRYSDTYSVLESSGNYTTTGPAATYGGGKWDAGTSTSPYFAKGIKAVANAIRKATNGQVQLKDLICLLSVPAATAIGDSAEMRDFYKGSVWTKEMLMDQYDATNESWGLPPKYAGVKLAIDGTLYVTGDPTSAGVDNLTPVDFKTSDTAIFLARIGGIDGVPGSTPFTSIETFFFGEGSQKTAQGQVSVSGVDTFLSVRVDDNSYQERVDLNVTQQYVVKMVAPDSAAYVTGILS